MWGNLCVQVLQVVRPPPRTLKGACPLVGPLPNLPIPNLPRNWTDCGFEMLDRVALVKIVCKM